jgi:hypothetical protein
MIVPARIRAELKEPLGKLASASSLKKLKSKKRMIIAVGDVVGRNLIKARISPSIWIYDGMVKRKPVRWELEFPTHIVGNPRGNITPSLMRAVDDAIRQGKGRIYVKGEEDLATLYCIAVAPIGALVIYGQPKKGMVVVEVGKESRKKAISRIFKCK